MEPRSKFDGTVDDAAKLVEEVERIRQTPGACRTNAAAELATLRNKGETPEQVLELVMADVKARHEHSRDWSIVLVDEIERLRAERVRS
jgi:hypothetical protein